MSRAVPLVIFQSLVFAVFLPLLTAATHSEGAKVVNSARPAAHASALEAQSRDPPNGICKESDQNVLIQGKLQVLMSKAEDDSERVGINPTPMHGPMQVQQVPSEKFATGTGSSDALKHLKGSSASPRAHEPTQLRQLPAEKFATGSTDALKHLKYAPPPPIKAPAGWFVFPTIGIFIMLLMQCTTTHPDSYSMEEEEKEDTTRPPQLAERLHLFDIIRFGLLVLVVWTQLLLAFGDDVIAPTLHQLVWPAWFFLAGIFGSSLEYESLVRVICYCLTTNILLICVGTLFAFLSYGSTSAVRYDVCGGAWVLWCLLLYRLTITPLFHVSRALRMPGSLVLIIILLVSHVLRQSMAAPEVVADIHPHQVEHVLLIAKSWDATIHAAVLNAPYFAVGLLMSPMQWMALLSSVWFRCAAAANGMVWLILIATPVLCSLGRWHCPEISWGVNFLMPADNLSGFREDVVCFLTRMSAVCLIVSLLFSCASLLQEQAPKLASHLGECGSRVRYTLALFVLWYMIRPSMLSPLQLPVHRSRGMSDLAMGCPALLLALVLTSSGTRQLFRWIVEPYWVKCCIEGCWRYLAASITDQLCNQCSTAQLLSISAAQDASAAKHLSDQLSQAAVHD